MTISQSIKSAAIAAVSTPEAKQLSIECLELTKGLGLNLVWLSEETAKAILHGLAFFATLLIWGLAELWAYVRAEVPRLLSDCRATIRRAVADAQGVLPQGVPVVQLPFALPSKNVRFWKVLEGSQLLSLAHKVGVLR